MSSEALPQTDESPGDRQAGPVRRGLALRSPPLLGCIFGDNCDVTTKYGVDEED